MDIPYLILSNYLSYSIIYDTIQYMVVNHVIYGVSTDTDDFHIAQAPHPHLFKCFSCNPKKLVDILYRLGRESIYTPYRWTQLNIMIKYLEKYDIHLAEKDDIYFYYRWLSKYDSIYGNTRACNEIYRQLKLKGVILNLLDLNFSNTISVYGIVTPLGNFYVYTKNELTSVKSFPKKCTNLELDELIDILYMLRAKPPHIFERNDNVMEQEIREYDIDVSPDWPRDKIIYYYSWLLSGFRGNEYDRIFNILVVLGNLTYGDIVFP